MTDVYYVALVVAFFALCVGYVRACGRVVGDEPPTTEPDAEPEPATTSPQGPR
jgi:hypothetical protein